MNISNIFDIELVKIIFLYREIRNAKYYLWLDYESILTNVVKEAKGNGDKRIGIVSNQKYKIKEAVELVYCFLKHPFEVVKFIEDEHLSSIVTLNILHAEEIYNAFYFVINPLQKFIRLIINLVMMRGSFPIILVMILLLGTYSYYRR